MATDKTTVEDAYEQAENPEQANTNKEKYKFWSGEIDAAEKRLKNWRNMAEKIVQRYAAVKADGTTAQLDGSGTKQFKLNVFYSNTITLESMLYGSIPKVDVSRRYADANDDISRVAAETMQRLLNCDLEDNGKEVDSTLKACLQDRLLAGLGCAKVRYHLETEEVPAPTEEYPDATTERMVSESAPIDYYYWGDVLWGWSRNYAQLPWIAFRNYMSRDEVAQRFGEDIAKQLTYEERTVTVTEDSNEDKNLNSETRQAEIWEIWDKKNRKVCWFNKEHNTLLDSKDDPLGLRGFFPTPPFFLANPTTTLYIPTPDYKQAEDLYNEVDILQTRISILTEAVKAVGVYDSASEGIQRIFTEGMDNTLIPVESWAAFAEKGGLRGAIEWVPLQDIVNALDKLVQQRNDAIGLLQQITGMSDVMRGQLENQYEGVGQSSIKAKFGSVRVQALQEQFATFATDLMQIKAEVIARHFSPETIIRRSNMEYSFDTKYLPKAVALIKQPDRARLGVKIESESMAMVDYAEMKAERTDFLNAVSQFTQAVTPIIQQRPESEPFLLKLMQWGLAGYKGSQQVEGLLDKTIEESEKAAQANQGKPSEEDKAAQREQAKQQSELQKIQAKAQADMQVREQDKQADMQTAQHQHVLDMKKVEAEGIASIMEIKAKSQAEMMKHRSDAENNVMQSAATTEQEIVKSQIQSELNIGEMIVDAETELAKMQKKSENDGVDNEAE